MPGSLESTLPRPPRKQNLELERERGKTAALGFNGLSCRKCSNRGDTPTARQPQSSPTPARELEAAETIPVTCSQALGGPGPRHRLPPEHGAGKRTHAALSPPTAPAVVSPSTHAAFTNSPGTTAHSGEFGHRLETFVYLCSFI